MLNHAVSRGLRVSVPLIPLAAVLLLCYALIPAVADEGEKPVNLSGPKVLSPASVQATKQRGPDFDTFSFTIGAGKSGGKGSPKRRQILFAYVGFAPSFPSDSAQGVRINGIKISGRPARNLQGRDRQSRRFREVLWQTGRRDFAQYVHFIYSGLTDTEARRADSIIASVRSS